MNAMSWLVALPISFVELQIAADKSHARSPASALPKKIIHRPSECHPLVTCITSDSTVSSVCIPRENFSYKGGLDP